MSLGATPDSFQGYGRVTLANVLPLKGRCATRHPTSHDDDDDDCLVPIVLMITYPYLPISLPPYLPTTYPYLPTIRPQLDQAVRGGPH